MMAWPLLLASLPLLQTAQDRIVLLDVGPLQPLPAWALTSEQSTEDRPATMRVVWTERQQISGPGRWAVAYGIDCEGRRIRRLSAPLDLNAGSFANVSGGSAKHVHTARLLAPCHSTRIP